MTCKIFIAAALSALPLFAAARPNVLLICVDDLKPALGCYGDPVAKTPAIDVLAARSVLYSSAYCNQAVCAPSRISLLTALRPDTVGVYDLHTDVRVSRPDVLTLPHHFKDHGYTVESLGKVIHNGQENPDSWTAPPWKPTAPTYANKANLAKAGQGLKRGAPYESADVSDETYADGLIAKEAIARLTASKEHPEQPFFLAVGFMKPHLPFVAPEKYWKLYDRDSLPLAEVRDAPAGAPKYAINRGGELRSRYTGVPRAGALDGKLERELVHGYYAATSYVDAQIGKVTDALDRLGLAENTVVVLWGDHGWHLGDHGMWCKHTNYEQAARIPLLVAAPGETAKSGVKAPGFVETVDIFPTICELAGLPVPGGLDGKSFARTLADPSVEIRDHVIHVFPKTKPGTGSVLGRAIRTKRYRLVEWRKIGAPASGAEFELYDYVKDPLETRNVIDSEPKAAARLKEILAGYPEAKPQVSRGKAGKSTGD